MSRRPQTELAVAAFVGVVLGLGTASLLTDGGADPARIRLAVVTALAIGFACMGVAYARNHGALLAQFRARSPRERRRASVLNYVGCGVLLLMIVLFVLIVVLQSIAA